MSVGEGHPGIAARRMTTGPVPRSTDPSASATVSSTPLMRGLPRTAYLVEVSAIRILHDDVHLPVPHLVRLLLLFAVGGVRASRGWWRY